MTKYGEYKLTSRIVPMFYKRGVRQLKKSLPFPKNEKSPNKSHEDYTTTYTNNNLDHSQIGPSANTIYILPVMWHKYAQL